MHSGEEAHNRVQHSEAQLQTQSIFKVPKPIGNGVPKHEFEV